MDDRSARLKELEKNIKSYREKSGSYSKYLKKLNTIKTNMSTLKSDIDKTYGYYKDGGYINGGETLDRGILIQSSKSLDGIIENLEIIIKDTNIKLNEINRSLKSFQYEYDEVLNSYY